MDLDAIVEWGAHIAGVVTTVLISFAIGVRRAQAKWAKTGAEIADAHLEAKVSEAKGDVIEFLREEVRRMAGVNAELAKQLNAFQIENIKLSAEHIKLRDQLNNMQEENAMLGLKLVELNQAINDFKAMFHTCRDCPNLKVAMPLLGGI